MEIGFGLEFFGWVILISYWHLKKNRIWCRQLRNVVNFSHATQKPQRLPPLGFSCINENYDRYKKRSCMEVPYSFMTCSGIEPGFTPWEGVVLTAWPTGRNRGDKIRTCDLCVPNAALYQTEPRDDVNINCVNIKIINKNPLIVKQKTNMIEEKVAKTIKPRN